MEETKTLHFSHSSVNLNAEQYRVVTSPQSENQRILASAGSGKTTTITARIAYLIEHYKLPPHRIVLVTFSRAAANEMRNRLTKLTGPVPIYSGTFHSLSLQLLREYAPNSLRDQPFIDELPHRLTEWLQTDHGRRWVGTLSAIIVDEFQDINNIQWRLLSLLHHRYASMSIVGDDAQNIYTWRGSSVDYILNFHTRFPRTTDYQLCRNYRSSAAIVAVANSIMRFIPTLPYKQKMVAVQPGGQKPQVHFFYRSSEEYEWIVRQIDSAYQQHTTQTFAVLARCNYDLYKIEEYLHRRALPYTLLTSYSPQDRPSSHPRRITLTTIHASKGLEWDSVYFMNLHDDVFPSRKTDEDIIAERRLFYVAVTRARSSLFFTYSRHERSLSRFVREIPRLLLTFHNIASYQLCTDQPHTSFPSIQDTIAILDGNDWHTLRSAGAIPDFSTPYFTESIYRFGEMFTVPEFVKTLDIRETWFTLIRWIFARELAASLSAFHSLRTHEVDTTLLSLRIYREDFAFWLAYEAEFEHLVHHFLSHSPRLPAIEYADLATYVTGKFPHLAATWSTQQMVQASVIIAKIRGQLRPLRHAGYDLTEFRFANTRNSVPTESRPFVLASWRAVTDPSRSTTALLPDLWNLAALTSVIEGRNIPLYQKAEVTESLLSSPMTEIAEAIVTAVQRWAPSLSAPVLFADCQASPNFQPFTFELLTETTAFATYFDATSQPSADDKIILLLKIFLYNNSAPASQITNMAFINLATGNITYYRLSEQTFRQAEQIWNRASTKLVL